MGAGLALLPEDLGGGGDSQRRKKRLSSRGFERLSSTQVRVPLSSSLLSSMQLEMKEATLCFSAFDIFLCCTLFLIRCYPQESNPLLSILISFSLGLLQFPFLLCVWANESPSFLWRSDAFAAAVTGSVTGSLWLSHLSLLQQIKAQGCRKSSLHSMLSSKLAGDVTQLKQKAQGKKNLSGTGSRDKEVSPCNSNPKYRHRSQGASKAESRRESGGQSDTGRKWQSRYWLCLMLFLF